jgi:hypothetical protein
VVKIPLTHNSLFYIFNSSQSEFLSIINSNKKIRKKRSEMKKLILRCVLVMALLLLFIGASSARAQMKTIEDPHGGTIVYGVVRGATKTATAMGSILRTIGDNCGERPQIGQVFRARGTNSDSVFFTVTNHPQGNKLVAGLLIAAPSGGQVEAALVSDDANRFGSTINPMLNRLFSEWHPGEHATSSSHRSAPPMPMQRAMLPDRSASVSVPSGWMVKGGGGTATIIETNYNAIININMVRGATNPGRRQNGPSTGMGARIVYPSNIDPVREAAGLIKEFYRMTNQNLDFRVENANLVAGTPRQRCVYAIGHGIFLGNRSVQVKDYWEMEALVCTTAPNNMGEYTVTLSLSEIDPRFADRERATVAAILMSYEVDQAVVAKLAGIIAAPAIDAIHQIGANATARMKANDIANDKQHADWNAQQDINARSNQGFHNYILDQSVVQNNNVYGTGAVGHSTEWNSVANALVKADPKKYEIVNYPNFWEGTDYYR